MKGEAMTSKDGVLARAWRSFGDAAAGYLTVIAGAILASDFGAAQGAFVKGFFASVGTALVAIASYYALGAATSALGRALATAGQFFIANTGVLVLADATQAAAIAWGQATLKGLAAAAVAGLVTFLRSRSEGAPTAPVTA